MTRDERKEYMKKYNYDRMEEIKARNRKWKAEHREEYNAKHKKWRGEHRKELNARKRKVLSEDLNANGVTKNNIRRTSRRILDKCHAKLSGYEIHHCFGYEDPNRFIYIPRSLHLQIHQLLRDNKIPADSDHWFAIRYLVNSCEEYTYIKA